MKKINLTIDNYLRNPLRWGKLPKELKPTREYGVLIIYGEDMPESLKKRWTVVIYIGKNYRMFSNYPLPKRN